MARRQVDRRQRLVRVREAQHRMAVAETLLAQERADGIADNARRLARVRAEMFAGGGAQLGGGFAAMRELADRLEQAGRQLEGALYDARKVVAAKQDRQVETNRDKEIALRLKERAVQDSEREQEARLAAIPRYRTMQQRGAE